MSVLISLCGENDRGKATGMSAARGAHNKGTQHEKDSEDPEDTENDRYDDHGSLLHCQYFFRIEWTAAKQ